jgi:acyl-CoA reductase-like NAD-dependent aldehyde dehydrogenase
VRQSRKKPPPNAAEMGRMRWESEDPDVAHEVRSAAGKKRWRKVPKKERREQMRKLAQARWKKAKRKGGK